MRRHAPESVAKIAEKVDPARSAAGETGVSATTSNSPVRPEAALSRRQLVFTVLRPVTAVERAHFRLRSDFGGSAGTTATRTLSGRHGNLTGGFRIQRRPPFFIRPLAIFQAAKKRRAKCSPLTLKNTEENRCGTRKTAERKKRTAEKRENRQVRRQSRHGPRKECKKKQEETRFPTVKKNKNGPFGDLSERESFIIFMSFYRNRSDMA